MRGIKTIERELAEARTMFASPTLGPTRDNSGKIVHNVEERRFRLGRAIERLEAELANLRKVVDRTSYGDYHRHDGQMSATAAQALDHDGDDR